MPFRSQKTIDMPANLLVDTLTSEEPIVAGRFEWVTAATREQLGDMATRSKTLAGTARTRVTPLTEASRRRFRSSSESPTVPEPEPSMSSTPWLLIASIVSVIVVLVVIAARRGQARSEEQRFEHPVEMDRLQETDTVAHEELPMHRDLGDDAVTTNPS